MIQVGLLILLLIIITLDSIFIPRYYDGFYLLTVLIIALIGFLVYLTKHESHQALKKQYLTISNIFLFGYMIVGFQSYIDLLLGNKNFYDYDIWVNPNNIVYSASVVTIGFFSYLLGNCFTIKSSDTIFYHQLKVTNIFLLKFLLVLVLVVFFATVNKAYLVGGYILGAEVPMGTTAKYMALIFHGVIFSVIVLHTRNLKIKEDAQLSVLNYINSYGILVVLSTIAYLSGVLLSGDRGPIITILMGFTIGYVYVTKIKIKPISLMIAGMIAAIVITFLGKLRSIITEKTLENKVRVLFTEQKELTNTSFLQPTQELAQSINTVHYVINYIPEKYDYFYGKFQLIQIRDAIPFLTGFISKLGYIKTADDKSISDYITWLAQGDEASYGNGSSIIADFYTAFGVTSVIVGMFLFGVFIRMLDIGLFEKRNLSLFLQTTAFVYFSNALYTSRSYALDSFKLIFLVLIIIFINKIILIGLRKR